MMFKLVGAAGIFAIALGFCFWAGLIYFVFWCLEHFGVLAWLTSL